MKARMNVYFDPEILRRVDELAIRKGLTKSAIIEAAVGSFLSPDGEDRREAAATRRLDRLTRQLERLERDIAISAEALALFVRFWLTVTPSLPDNMQAAAKAKGTERYHGFVEVLGRRVARGQSVLREISLDVSTSGGAEKRSTHQEAGD
jgi:hypothetical protein